MIVAHILADKGSDVITIEPERTLADAARLLAERRIGAVVVADAKSPVRGIISERDITRAVARRGGAALEQPVSQHMTAKLFTCTRAGSVANLCGGSGLGRRAVPTRQAVVRVSCGRARSSRAGSSRPR